MDEPASSSSDDNRVRAGMSQSTKKRRNTGRLRDVAKKLRLQGHEVGESCKCVRYQCFEKVCEDERKAIVRNFNLMNNWNDQSSYLTGLMSMTPVMKRSSKSAEQERRAKLRNCSFHYKVRVSRGNGAEEIPVCKTAFISMHGITRRRIETIQSSMMKSGLSPTDLRGRHGNRPHKIPEDTLKIIKNHINSFKGRYSHYSLKKTSKVYLPEDLNIRKMYHMYLEKNPANRVSYEYYRHIFNTCFNISFGYPRKDTCSTCDVFTNKVKEVTDPSVKKRLQTYQKLHLLKAQSFYDRKRHIRKKSRIDKSIEGICMDFNKNLSVPNIATNDVYYKRQLSLYSFNIHRLGDQHVVFYAYPETLAKKGSNEVCSFLHDYCMHHLPLEVQHFHIFADSCGGQNKNWTVIRFLHWIVSEKKRFNSVTVTFPIRGHSYMECDKDMALVDQNIRAEVPNDWIKHFKQVRCKPSPFCIEEVDQYMVRDWTEFFKTTTTYAKVAPMKTRSVRQLKFDIEHPRLVYHRDTFNGAWISSILSPADVKTSRQKKKRVRKRIDGGECSKQDDQQRQQLQENEFFFPSRSYTMPLPISNEKYNDLQHLKQFCSSRARQYFETLTPITPT